MEQLQDAKQKFWQAIKAEPINGHRFTQHVLVEPFIVDFACVEHKVIIELDDVAHSVNDHRTDYLRRQGYHVVRLFRDDVNRDIRQVMSQLHSQL